MFKNLRSNINPEVMAFTPKPFPDAYSIRVLRMYGKTDGKVFRPHAQGQGYHRGRLQAPRKGGATGADRYGCEGGKRSRRVRPASTVQTTGR